MPNLKAIGRRIAGLRTEATLTQSELSVILGLSRSTVAGIESGNDRGGIESMVAIADYFKVPMDWLLCRKVPAGGPLAGQVIDDPDEVAWVSFWRGLTHEDRAAVLRTLRISNDGRDAA